MELPPEVHVDGVAHATVALDGFAAHVASAGEGEPVVLLHGWPGHWWTWRHLIAPLVADGRRVVCPDLRGFGWSSAGDPSSIGFERFARDLVDLLDALDLGAGGPRRARLGVVLRVHRVPAVARALPPLRGDERAEPAPAVHARGASRTCWRLWYQQVIAAPVVGQRTVRGSRVARRRASVGGSGWTRCRPAEREAFASRLREPERVAASVGLYRHAVLARRAAAD